jgi:hypothetical protein
MATCSYSSKDSVDAGHWKVGFTYTYVFSGIGTYLGKRVHLGYEVNQTSDIALDCQINVKVNGSWVNNPSDYLDIGVFGNDTLTFKLKKDISNDSYISWASVSNATLQSYIQNDSTLVNLPWEYLSIGGVN